MKVSTSNLATLLVSHYYDLDVTQSHAPVQQALLDAKCSACSRCQTRKIKCGWNGNSPCSACIKSRKRELCSTAASVNQTTTCGCSLPPSQPAISVASSAPSSSISQPPDTKGEGIPEHQPAGRKRSYESEINDSDDPSTTGTCHTRHKGPANLASLGSTSHGTSSSFTTSSLMGTLIAECDEDEDLKDSDVLEIGGG